MPTPNVIQPRFGGAGTPFQEVPVGAIDNVNVTFTLAHLPWAGANLVLFLDRGPVPQGAGAGKYTLSGTTITMGTAPALGQTLYAFYYY